MPEITQTPNRLHALIDQLRGSPYIREKRFGEISSFNFSRSAFYEGHWDDVTTKARGLFINTRTEQIVARGYDKFFNVDENPQSTMDALKKQAVYPIEVYKKENGYLGLISWDRENGKFIFATKSMLESSYVEDLRDIFYHSGINTEEVAKYLSHTHIPFTMIVEVIDPILDPHIIEYNYRHLVLLDIVSNTIEPRYLIYPLLSMKAREFNMDVKAHVQTTMDWKEVEQIKWLCEHPAFVDSNGQPFEGYVFRDSANHMFKMKTAYYLKWKKYRWQADRIIHDLPVQQEQDPFLSWVESNKDKLAVKNIIDMRNMYEQTHTA